MADIDQKLSPDEMEALREVATEESPGAITAEEAARIQVHSYNFRQPGRLSSAQLGALTVVHEYFVKRFSEERFGGLDLPLGLTLLSVETVSYSNFMGSVANPCFMVRLSSRFEQAVLLDIDPRMARFFVSRILGDTAEPDEAVRALTSIEQAIAGNWLEGLLPILGESWKLSAPVEFALDRIESDPRFVHVLSADSPVVSLTFRLKAESSSGQMTLCYPLEPLQELLEGMSLQMSGSGEEDGNAEPDGERVLNALKRVPFELRAELGCCTVSANLVASVKIGDVRCLDRWINDAVDVLLDDKLVFEAKLGRKGDSLALRLSQRVGK
jgi:flagellar motor switch protein FliM